MKRRQTDGFHSRKKSRSSMGGIKTGDEGKKLARSIADEILNSLKDLSSSALNTRRKGIMAIHKILTNSTTRRTVNSNYHLGWINSCYNFSVPDPYYQKDSVSKLYDLIITRILNHLQMCLQKGLKKSRTTQEDVTCLSKILSSIDIDHLSAYSSHILKSSSPGCPPPPISLLSPSPVFKKTSNPPTFSPLAPTSLYPTNHVYPVSYLSDETLKKVMEHCIIVLSDESYLDSHPHIYQDCHSCLHHMFSLPSLILGLKPKTILAIYDFLVDKYQTLTRSQCSKLLNMILSIDSTYNRLSSAHVHILIPHFLHTLAECKKNLQTHENETIIVYTYKSLHYILSSNLCMPPEMIASLLQTISLSLRIYPRADQNGVEAILFFLSSLSERCEPTMPKIDTISRTIVETITQKRWEEGRRRKQKIETLYSTTVSRYLHLYMSYREMCCLTQLSEHTSTYLIPLPPPLPPLPEDILTSFLSSISLSSPSPSPSPSSSPSPLQHWATLSALVSLSSPPPSYVNFDLIHQHVKKYLTGTLQLHSKDDPTPHVVTILLKTIPSLPSPTLYEYLPSLLSSTEHPHLISSAPLILVALAKFAKIDVGNLHGVGHVVTFTDVNLLLPNSTTTTRRHKIVETLASTVTSLFSEMTSSPPPFNFEDLFLQIKDLCSDSFAVLHGRPVDDTVSSILFNSTLFPPTPTSSPPQAPGSTNIVGELMRKQLCDAFDSYLPTLPTHEGTAPPSSLFPLLLFTLIKLSTTSTSPVVTSKLISDAISAFTDALPTLSLCRVTFMRSSTLLRNIISYTAHISMSSAPPPDLPDFKRLYELCCKIVKGFFMHPCPSSPDKELDSKPEDDPWDVDDTSGHQRKTISLEGDSDMATQQTTSSSQRGSTFDDSDSDSEYNRPQNRTNFTQNMKKRKTHHQHQQNPLDHNSDTFLYPDSEGALIISAILAILSPTKATLQILASSFAWPTETFIEFRQKHHNVQLYHEANPSDIVSCVRLFMTPAAILSDYRLLPPEVDDDIESDGDVDPRVTVPYTLCQMLESAQAISPAASPFHGCGYDFVNKMVEIGKSTFVDDDATCILAHAVTHDSQLRKSVRARDDFRAKQLASLTAIYLNCSGELFKECKKVFDTQLFKGVKDASEEVRKVAVDAVGASFAIDDPDNQLFMFDALLEKLPPLPATDDEAKIMETWDSFVKSASNNKTTLDEKAMLLLRKSMEATSIAAIGKVATSTPNSLVTRKAFSKLIELAAVRQDLTVPIASTCFSMSKSLGFPSLTDMISDDIEYIMEQWLSSNLSLLKLPLILCDPASQEELIRCGTTSLHNPESDDDDNDPNHHVNHSQSNPPTSPSPFTQLPASKSKAPVVDIEQIQMDKQHDFLKRNSPTIIPLILSSMAKSQEEDRDEIDTRGYGQIGDSGESFSESLNSSSRNDGFTRLSECCFLIIGKQSDDAIASLLKEHIQDIYSVATPLLCNEKNMILKSKGVDILEKLKGCISEDIIDREIKKVTDKIILRILHNLSTRCFETPAGVKFLEDDAFFNAIDMIAERLSNKSEVSEFTHSVFHEAGSSVVEILINIKNWFDKSHTDGQLKRLINTLSHFVRIVVQESEEKKLSTGLGMCIQVSLALLLDNKLRAFRNDILTMLDSLISVCLSEKDEVVRKKRSPSKKKESGQGSNRGQLCRLLNKTVHTLVDCYDTAVRNGRKVEEEERAKERVESIESLGLLGLSEGNNDAGVWGWDGVSTTVRSRRTAQMLISKTNEEEKVVKSSCLNLLEDILIKSDSSMDEELQTLDPLPPCDGLDKDDDLTKLLSKFLQRKGVKNDEGVCYLHLKRFINFCVRYSKERENKAKQQGVKGVKIMLTLVEESFQSLDEIYQGGGKFLTASNVHYPLFYNTLKHLSQLCKEENDHSIKVAAAATLGNISHYNWSLLVEGEGANASMEKYEFADTGEYLNADGDDRDNEQDSMVGFKIKILKNLGYSLLTDRAETALIAMETAKKILCTRAGAHAMNMLSDDDPTKEILVAISGKAENQFKSHHGVDEIFIKSLWGRGKKANCWEHSLWACESPGSEAYEGWIKKLVTAIILVCYWRFEKNSKRGKKKSIVGGEALEDLDEMLKLCAEMTCKDASFAEVVFPALVLDLLEKGGEGRGQGRGEWMIGNTGDSFINKQLTKGFDYLIGGESSNVFAITVAVEVFDSLRVITNKGFLEWGGHKKNMNSLKGRKYPDLNNVSNDRRRSRPPDPTESQKYNENLGDIVEWHGIPFGIVLRLDGLSVARACLKAKRPCSALMYLETYCDNVFGGSSECLEGCGERGKGRGDVSGFGEVESEAQESEEECGRERIEKRKMLKMAFQQAYDMLGEEDAVIGVENATIGLDFRLGEGGGDGGWGGEVGFFTDPWKKVREADMKLQGGAPGLGWKVCLGEGLQELGLNHVGSGYLDGKGMEGQGQAEEDFNKLEEMWHEGAWRTMTWGREDGGGGRGVVLGGGSKGFHSNLHNALGNILQNDREAFGKNVKDGMKGIAEVVGRTADGEGMMRTFLQNGFKLWSLKEVERMGRSLTEGEGERIGKLVEEWSVGKGEEGLKFSQRMFIDDVREVGTRIIMRRVGRDARDEYAPFLFNGLQRRLKEAIKEGWVREAGGILERLRNLEASERNVAQRIGLGFFELKLLEAELLWAEGDFMGAIRLGKLLVEKGEANEEGGKFLAQALLKCGKWVALSKTDATRVVIDRYLKPSVKLSRLQTGGGEEAAESHLVLAEFLADSLDAVETRMNSVEWKKAGKKIQRMKNEIEQCEKLYDEKTDKFKKLTKASLSKKPSATEKQAKDKAEKEMKVSRNYMSRLKKEMDLDEKERSVVLTHRTDFMKLSLQNFMHGLTLGDGVGAEGGGAKHIFRFVSIWFKNTERDGVNKIISKAVESMPSFLFVPLIYQLFSRIGSGGNDFRSALYKLVRKICIDHPHHGIVQLLALAHGTHTGNERNRAEFLKNVVQDKSETAKQIIYDLKKSGGVGELPQLVESMETLCEAYINLAWADTKKYNNSKQKDIQLTAIAKKGEDPLHLCLGRGRWGGTGRGGGGAKVLPAILTKPPKVQKDTDYSMLTGSDLLVGFETTCQITTTGLSRPKIVMALGETGKKYKQLVKGDDDVRQDAVVQLVFTLVNRLLGNKKDLNITTYSVVPLSPQTGVLEWCLNTEPFGEFLLDQGSRIGAHSRYFPGSWGSSLCRNHVRHAPPGKKVEAFQEVMKRFPPAFRFFFQEKFGFSLPAWFGARQNYTRSCAVTSIVGHILGIGDRHCHNILINNKTGNVVHIDFGIVFEQGKILPTPETIPFRLTSDIVDGLGVTGVEGVFHKSCCDVLTILRQNGPTLLTVLDVIANDPMYKFLISPIDKEKIQGEGRDREEREEGGGMIQDSEEERDWLGDFENNSEDDEDRNAAATRVLAKIASKLRGFEDNTPEQLSIDGQVLLLINEARSIENLSRLYIGWQSWV